MSGLWALHCCPALADVFELHFNIFKKDTLGKKVLDRDIFAVGTMQSEKVRVI